MRPVTTPTAGYSNVSDLKSLRKEREIKQAINEKYEHAQSFVDRVEAKIEDVAELGKTKHNQSLKPDQVVLDQYRNGLKFAAATAGNVLVNIATLSLCGTEVLQGTDAVLNRDAQGKVTSFEAQETVSGKKYSHETSYSKQVQDDGSTVYKLAEEERPSKAGEKPLSKSTTVKMESNGTLFIQES